MSLIVYTLCWNEEVILPYFLRYYQDIADKIVIYDSFSDDQSQLIIKQHPKTEYRRLDLRPEDVKVKTRNTCWKESRKYDWVIVCDIDEFVWHPNLKQLLESNATIFKCIGYNMISQALPATNGQIWEEIQYGHHTPKWDKCLLFSPAKIKDINFSPGSHECKPNGDVKWGDNKDLKLLHYHYLGLDYVLSRYALKAKRMPAKDRRNGWGMHYLRPQKVIKEHFNTLWEGREKVV